MKKVLFLASLAAMAMASCTSESNEYVGDNTPKEIAFMPINQKATRGTGAILNGIFPTGSNMEVAAYTGGIGQLFGASTFTHRDGTIWSGSKYWPLSPCFVNFLAYANLTLGSATWGTNTNDDASKVVLAMGDNATTQNDLLYAVAQGQVQQNGNILSFPSSVPMTFKHAQSLLTFNLKAADVASQAIQITNIVLKNAHFSGTYTIDNSSNYNVSTSASPSVTGSWTTVGAATETQAVSVSGTLSETRTGQIMVVPNGESAAFDKFIINYTLNSAPYTFEYIPTNRVLTEGKNYVYDITFRLNEILIDASVASWIENGTVLVDIPTVTYVENGTKSINIPAAAGKYSITIKNLAAASYTVVVGTGDFITIDSPTTATDVAANGDLTITFTVASSAGNTQEILIKVSEDTKFTLNVTQAAAAP